MNTDQLPISIARYADGTLPQSERARVEALLSSDPSATAMLQEEQALTGLLRSDPLPEMDWDSVAARISGAIDDEIQQRVDRASWMLRLRSATAYFGARGLIAAAASFVLGLGLAAYTFHSAGPEIAINGKPSDVAPSVADNNLMRVAVDSTPDDQSTGRAVEEVSIGPGGTYASGSGPSPYSDEISARPARVVIAADGPAQPSYGSSPF